MPPILPDSAADHLAAKPQSDPQPPATTRRDSREQEAFIRRGYDPSAPASRESVARKDILPGLERAEARMGLLIE